MLLSELSADIQQKLRKERAELCSRWKVNTPYQICFTDAEGTRYFTAVRKQSPWNDDKAFRRRLQLVYHLWQDSVVYDKKSCRTSGVYMGKVRQDFQCIPERYTHTQDIADQGRGSATGKEYRQPGRVNRLR